MKKMLAKGLMLAAGKLGEWSGEKQKPLSPAMMVSGKPKPRSGRSYGNLVDAADGFFGLTLSHTTNNDIYRYKNSVTNLMRLVYQSNPYVKKIVRHTQNQVLGDGFVLRPRFRMRNGDLDNVLNAEVADAFREWTKDHCDIEGRRTLRAIEATIMYGLLIEGEAFVQFARQGRHGFSMQIIESWRVDVHHLQELENGRQVQMGVEMNGHGRPVGYHVVDQLPLSSAFNAFPVSGRATARRIRASNMAHVYLAEFPEQIRGMPLLAQAVGRFDNLADYEEAELRMANIGSSKTGFLTKQYDSEYTGRKDAEDGRRVMAGVDDSAYIEELPAGMDFKAWDIDHPKGEYANFHEKQLQGASTVSGIDYATVSGDTSGANFSTLRQVNIQQRDLFKEYHTLLTEQFRQRVFRRWLMAADGTGMLRLPRHILDNERERERVEFVQRSWAHVQPREQASAEETQVNMRVRSLTEIIEESGRDPDTVFEQIAEEQKKMAELGITRGSPSAKADERVEVDPETGEEKGRGIRLV